MKRINIISSILKLTLVVTVYSHTACKLKRSKINEGPTRDLKNKTENESSFKLESSRISLFYTVDPESGYRYYRALIAQPLEGVKEDYVQLNICQEKKCIKRNSIENIIELYGFDAGEYLVSARKCIITDKDPRCQTWLELGKFLQPKNRAELSEYYTALADLNQKKIQTILDMTAASHKFTKSKNTRPKNVDQKTAEEIELAAKTFAEKRAFIMNYALDSVQIGKIDQELRSSNAPGFSLTKDKDQPENSEEDDKDKDKPSLSDKIVVGASIGTAVFLSASRIGSAFISSNLKKYEWGLDEAMKEQARLKTINDNILGTKRKLGEDILDTIDEYFDGKIEKSTHESTKQHLELDRSSSKNHYKDMLTIDFPFEEKYPILRSKIDGLVKKIEDKLDLYIEDQKEARRVEIEERKIRRNAHGPWKIYGNSNRGITTQSLPSVWRFRNAVRRLRSFFPGEITTTFPREVTLTEHRKPANIDITENKLTKPYDPFMNVNARYDNIYGELKNNVTIKGTGGASNLTQENKLNVEAQKITDVMFGEKMQHMRVDNRIIGGISVALTVTAISIAITKIPPVLDLTNSPDNISSFERYVNFMAQKSQDYVSFKLAKIFLKTQN